MKRTSLAIILVVFIILLSVSMTLFSKIPNNTKTFIRISFILMSAASWYFCRKNNYHKASLIAFSFLALNLAFLIVKSFTSSYWKLDVNTSKGIAQTKFSDSAIISVVNISSFLIAIYGLKSIYLTREKLLPGIPRGIIFLMLFGYLAMTNSQQKPGPGFLEKNWLWILNASYPKRYCSYSHTGRSLPDDNYANICHLWREIITMFHF